MAKAKKVIPKILISLDGGLIQSARSNVKGLEVIICDFDTQDSEEEAETQKRWNENVKGTHGVY